MSANRAFEAIRAGNAETLREVLADDPTLAMSRDETGLSPLMQACYRKRPDLIALLRTTGCKLDLFEAAAVGDSDCAAALLVEGPQSLHEYSSDGFTALHLAAFFGHEPVVSLLLEHGADADVVSRNGADLRPIHSAAAAADHACVQKLLDCGADVHARQRGGFTALHAAAAAGEIGLIETLLGRGADPGHTAEDGKDAAAIADERGHADAAGQLRGRSAR